MNRGFVLVGDITDGTISVGDFVSIPNKDKTISVQILGVEMIDKISERIAHVGLVISTNDMEKVKDLRLKGTSAKKTWRR